MVSPPFNHGLLSDTFGRGLVVDIVLGVSMAPASVQMIVVEGENADGALVEDDEFDVVATDESATAGVPDQVISAILGTREGAADSGLHLSSIGVTWTDPVEAAVLRDALAAYKLENVMLVSAFLAATALAQSVGGAMGYDRTAVLFVEPESATLAVVETADGSITDVYKESIDDASSDEATAQLTGMLAGLEEVETAPRGVFLVGSGVDIASIKPTLESATSLSVSAPEEPETALARGAALASANAPLFASSTAALAYAQDPGTGAVDPFMPEYLGISHAPPGAERGEDDLAYSLVPDDDADAPTVLISNAPNPDDSAPRRSPVLLLGSGWALVGISAVVALEIALAVGIRSTVALQPSPNQSLIIPTQQAPAPPAVEALAPKPMSVPAAVAAPRPLNPLPAAAGPAAPVPAAPVGPGPVVVPPVAGGSMPPVPLAPRLSHPQVHVPQQPETGLSPQSPVHQMPPNEGTLPRSSGPGGQHGAFPGSGPGGAGGGSSIHAPGAGPGGPGGGEPGSSGPFGGGGGGPFGGGEPASPGPFGGGGHGGEEGGPFGGGPFGGGGGSFGGGGHGGDEGGPFGGGPFGGGGGPFGGGPFGGGGGP